MLNAHGRQRVRYAVFDWGPFKSYAFFGFNNLLFQVSVMLEQVLPIEADLTLLRSQMPTKRRQTRRFRCNLATMAKLQVGEDCGIKVAWAYNLSLGGVGLNSSDPLDVSRDVIIHFRLNGKDVSSVPARIVFCHHEIDKSWRIGCEFHRPISQETLDALLN
jgi:PilZ domain